MRMIIIYILCNKEKLLIISNGGVAVLYDILEFLIKFIHNYLY